MKKNQLNKRESAVSAKNSPATDQPTEVVFQENSHLTAPQTLSDEKWSAIKTGIIGIVIFSGLAIIVFGTRGRTFRFNGSYGDLTFAMSLSRAAPKAA